MAALSEEGNIGPPWGAIIIVDAHGEKLEKKINGNGVLLNQGNDFFGNYISIRSARRVKAEILNKSESLAYYKDILKREKKQTIDNFNSGKDKKPKITNAADRKSFEFYLGSGDIIDEFSLDGCNDYLFVRDDPSPVQSESFSIECVYIHPSLKQRMLGKNLFSVFHRQTLKLSHIVDFYNHFKSKLPLCVISLACPYENLTNRQTDLLLSFERGRYSLETGLDRGESASSSREGAEAPVAKPDEDDFERGRYGLETGLDRGESASSSREGAEAPVAKPDEDDFDVDAFENLGGSKRKMNPKRKKKNPTRKKKSISRKSKKRVSLVRVKK